MEWNAFNWLSSQEFSKKLSKEALISEVLRTLRKRKSYQSRRVTKKVVMMTKTTTTMTTRIEVQTTVDKLTKSLFLFVIAINVKPIAIGMLPFPQSQGHDC